MDTYYSSSGERLFTTQDLSLKWNVSTKTIQRWVHRKLIQQCPEACVVDASSRRVLFLASDIEKFQLEYANILGRASSFKQFSAEDKQDMLCFARVHAHSCTNLTELYGLIADRFLCTTETARKTICSNAPDISEMYQTCPSLKQRQEIEYVFDDRFADEMFVQHVVQTNDAEICASESLLSRDQEQQLFLKYNALKYLISKNQLPLSDIEKAQHTRNSIFCANTGMAEKAASHYASKSVSRSVLMSDCSVALLRMIDLFDVSKGNAFSSYAYVSLIHTAHNSSAKEKRKLHKFATGQTGNLNDVVDTSTNPYVEEMIHQACRDAMSMLLDFLGETERRAIERRYRFDEKDDDEPFDGFIRLRTIGKELGLSKERIRQILARAMTRLRIAVGENPELLTEYEDLLTYKDCL